MRTIGVELEAKTAGFQAGVEGAARATKTLADNIGETVVAAKESDRALGGLDRQLRGTGRAADAAGRDVHGFESDLHRLDAAIAETEVGLKSLARQFAASGNSGLLKEIRAGQAELRKLQNVKNLLPRPEDGEQAGRSLMQYVGTGMSAVSGLLGNHVGLTIAGAAGLAAAPVLSGAISAAITAGASAGVLGLGVVLAAKGDRVVAERGKAIGHAFMSGLESEASRAFQGPLLQSLDRLEAAGARITGKLGRAFDNLAPHLVPLVGDVVRGAERVVDSLGTAAARSGPALDALGKSVVLLSDGVGTFLDEMSAGGATAAANLELVAGATADVIKQTGGFLAVLNDLSSNPWLTGPLLPLLRSHYKDMADSTKAAADNGTGLNSVYQGIVPTLNSVEGAAAPLALTLQDIADAARDLHTANADLYSSETNVAQALADANKKIKENGKGLDLNTQKGRDNRAALDNVATALQNQYDKYVAVNGVVPGTKRLADDLRAKFIKLAEKAGLSADAAQTLANKILGIPKSKDIKIHANTHDAEGRIAALQAKINALHGRQLTIDLAYRVTGSKASRSAVAAALDKQSLPARASGGPVTRGMSYLVGENGAEVFTAPATGRIIPNGGVYGTYAAPAPTWIGGGGSTSVVNHFDVTVNGANLSNSMELENQLVRALDRAASKGRLSGIVDSSLGRRADYWSRT